MYNSCQEVRKCGRGKLTPEEQETLRRNQNAAKVTGSSIVGTNAFKMHFVEEYAQGKTPQEIFVNAGFDVSNLMDPSYKV